MKTRNGFVSNSSSSSFIVAFPKKPKNGAEVWEMMFSGKDGHITCYDNEALSHSHVASNVFHSLSAKKFKKATLKDIMSEFDGRYHYYPKASNVFWVGKTTDEKEGAWSGKIGRYYGSDTNLINKLRDFIIKCDNEEKDLDNQEKAIVRKSGIRQPPYAYKGGTRYGTKTPYTDEEVANYEAYQFAMEEFKKTNAEYVAWRKERDKLRKKKFEIENKLSARIAMKDAQNFLDDNKGKFIFIVEYCDNDGGDGGSMEHGEIFRNVPHVQVSKH